MIARPDIIAFDRLLAAEAREHPGLIAAFWKAGPGRIVERLADVLQEMVPRRDEAERAAARFLSMLLGEFLLRERHGQASALGEQDRTAHATSTVELFLKGLQGGQ